MDYLKQKFSGKFLTVINVSFFFFSCLALLVTVYFYITYKKSEVVGVNDKAAMILKVSKLLDLPQGENPQIVTINNISLFKDQIFFSRARLGDILIVYAENHIAILYDPKENKIVNMSKIMAIVNPPPAL